MKTLLASARNNQSIQKPSQMKSIPIRKMSSTQDEPSLNGSFDIRKITDILRGKDLVQNLHRHDFFFILVLEKGDGRHVIDFTSHTIGDHSIYIMRPGQVHELYLKNGSTGYLLQFKNDFYLPHEKLSKQVWRGAIKTNNCKLESIQFGKIAAPLSNIFQEYSNQSEGYKEIIKANLNIFFIEFSRNSKCAQKGINIEANYAQERLDEFVDLIDAHAHDHKQVATYADMLNLSTYQLNRIVKTTLGKTSSDLINEHLILESKRHLLTTSRQVKEIAHDLGYEDVSYFVRFFKKHTGYSPDNFRQIPR